MIKAITCAMASTAFCICMTTNQSFAQKKGKLTDPEIASVAVTANQIDIDNAEIAKKKSKDADVIKFADAMAADHKAIIDQAVALVTRLKVTPQDNAVSKQLMTNADKTKAMLNSKSGKDFDKAYIDNEVSYHKSVIATVQGLLIPEAQNPELKELLMKAVPTFKAHLAHAQMVQSKMSGAPSHMSKM